MVLADVKVGDLVAVSRNSWTGNVIQQEKVTAVTKTQFTTDSGSRYLKADGRLFGNGGSFYSCFAQPWTEKSLEECKKAEKIQHRHALVTYLTVNASRNFFKKMSDEDLEALKVIFEKYGEVNK